MLDLLCNQWLILILTFIFSLILIAKSKEVIQYLLDQTSNSQLNSTLTIWGTDNISQEEIEALKAFIIEIGKERVYVDTAYDLNPLENHDIQGYKR